MASDSSGSDSKSGLEYLFPPLERADRLKLLETLAEGSRWNMNFGMMLSCSVLIAGLGLLQNSPAVIIGAMLVAPLMTPLIGTGLALVQGNFKLLGEAARAMAIGSSVSLVLGILLRFATPGNELTPEVTVRGDPNILDLMIAFLAGVAAGYAVARPRLSGALPGVAISVALVPPLAASGIALGSGQWLVAFGAQLLFVTNMVAIVLGSALVFRLHGIKVPERHITSWLTTRRILVSLGFILILLTAPLGYRLISQVREGVTRAESLSLSEDLYYKMHDRLDKEEGIDFLTGVRASAHRPEDVTLVVTANRPVPMLLLTELDQMIDEEMGVDVKVKMSVLQQGKLDSTISPEIVPDISPETKVNE